MFRRTITDVKLITISTRVDSGTKKIVSIIDEFINLKIF